MDFKFSDKYYPDVIGYKDESYKLYKHIKTNRGCVNVYKSTSNSLAFKFIHKSFRHYTTNEMSAHKLLIDPPIAIVKMIEMKETNDYIILISQGFEEDLFEHSNHIDFIPLFNDVIKLLKTMLEIVQYFQGLNLVYCDFKLENMVIDNDNNYYLIDFDTLEKTNENGYVYNSSGTLGFRSLQRLTQKNQDDKSRIYFPDDIWSLSIVLYEFITKSQTTWNNVEDFTIETQKEAVRNIKNSTRHWTQKQRKHIIFLFLKMNEYDEKKRMKVNDLLSRINGKG
jgi:serine/threonine protein kinase